MCVNGCRDTECQYWRLKNNIKTALSRAKKKHGIDSLIVQELESSRANLTCQHASRIRGENHGSGEQSQKTSSSESIKLSMEQENTQSVKETKTHRHKFDAEGNLMEVEVEESKSYRLSNKTTPYVEFKHSKEVYQVDADMKETREEFYSDISDSVVYVESVFSENDDTSASGAKFVYVMRAADTDFVKIGFSQDVFQRLSQLQTGCPIIMNVKFCFETVLFREMEAFLHRYFASAHVHREWFAVKDPVDWQPIFQQFFARKHTELV
jgi:hypothetical protein